MKLPIVMITTLLPLATQLALANPVAADSDSSLEKRGGGYRNDKDKHWGDKHDHSEDWCKVKKTYWYHKYPCDSSETVGQSKVGDTFAPVCKYQNWYKNSKGWWVKDEYKPWHCDVKVDECP